MREHPHLNDPKISNFTWKHVYFKRAKFEVSEQNKLKLNTVPQYMVYIIQRSYILHKKRVFILGLVGILEKVLIKDI